MFLTSVRRTLFGFRVFINVHSAEYLFLYLLTPMLQIRQTLCRIKEYTEDDMNTYIE